MPRIILAILLSVMSVQSEIRNKESFPEIVHEADYERELLKTTGEKFRSLAAKLRPIFRD